MRRVYDCSVSDRMVTPKRRSSGGRAKLVWTMPSRDGVAAKLSGVTEVLIKKKTNMKRQINWNMVINAVLTFITTIASAITFHSCMA